MALEIRESIIRINILDKKADDEFLSKDTSIDDTQSIVKECVDQVLEILKEMQER